MLEDSSDLPGEPPLPVGETGKEIRLQKAAEEEDE
jgi:hypothetical protein